MSSGSHASLSVSDAARLLRGVNAGTTELLGMLGGEPALVVELSGQDLRVPTPSLLPCVVVGVERGVSIGPAPVGVDLAITTERDDLPSGWVGALDVDNELERVLGCVAASPQASVVLAEVLRLGTSLNIDRALLAESLAYSTLQSSETFNSWLATRPPPVQGRTALDPSPVVLNERTGDELTIRLSRPHVRNAVSARLRDELCDALVAACADPTIGSVHLRAEGPDFSSGGDLTEFGLQLDRGEAHVIRTTRSPARLLARLGERTVAHLHGACIGAGIELPAFAGHVVATPDAYVRLPEVGFGLIPGAGGTVSVPRRIGRHRCAWLGITGAILDASTALRWRLFDSITAAS